MKIIYTGFLSRIAALVLVASLLGGCSSTGDRYLPEYYTVQPGDTLYSIAWSVGVDYHKLAEWNDISSDYTIHPGQKLRILPPGDKGSQQPTSKKAGAERRYHQVRKGDTLYSIARNNRVSVSQLRKWNGLSRNSRIYPGQKIWLAGKGPGASASRTAVTKPASRNTSIARAASNSAKPKRGSIRWSWPVKGAILTSYDQKSGRKGINIAGNRGQPIRAAAAGTIVYQGSGLRGYGRLIIVKHNNDFLSAYAHCDSFTLREGSKVGRGTVIAKMGATGTSRNQLHFEIRYRGNPVNPVGYLPSQ